MAKQHARSKVRDRETFRNANGVDVLCPKCERQRWAHAWIPATPLNDRLPVDMATFVDWQDAMWNETISNDEREDWKRVVCPRCGLDWRGSLHDVAFTVRTARSLGLNRAVLRKAPPTRTSAPSRRW